MLSKKDAAYTFPEVRLVRAVEFIRSMHGGAYPKLLRCSDGRFYVVKFQNNPQGIRILANEMLAALLANTVGLPVPRPAIVEVPWELVWRNNELTMGRGSSRVQCCPGLCFGSAYAAHVVDPSSSGDVLDWLRPQHLNRVENISDFIGILAFDKWIGNADVRQVIFVRRNRALPFGVYMIDNGLSFNGQAWNFQIRPRLGLHLERLVYSRVTGMDAFEPWIVRIQQAITSKTLSKAARMIPINWYGKNRQALSNLLARLEERIWILRKLLEITREMACEFFPAWATCRHSEFNTLNCIGGLAHQEARPRPPKPACRFHIRPSVHSDFSSSST